MGFTVGQGEGRVKNCELGEGGRDLGFGSRDLDLRGQLSVASWVQDLGLGPSPWPQGPPLGPHKPEAPASIRSSPPAQRIHSQHRKWQIHLVPTILALASLAAETEKEQRAGYPLTISAHPPRRPSLVSRKAATVYSRRWNPR